MALNIVKKLESRTKFLKKYSAITIFSVAAFIGGIFFMKGNSSAVTGQTIQDVESNILTPLSVIGGLLVICSMVLVGYIIRRKTKE